MSTRSARLRTNAGRRAIDDIVVKVDRQVQEFADHVAPSWTAGLPVDAAHEAAQGVQGEEVEAPLAALVEYPHGRDDHGSRQVLNQCGST